MQHSEDERRSFPRLPFLLRVTAGEGPEAAHLVTLNVSMGGALLVGPAQWEVGQPVTVAVGFPGFLEDCVVDATVRWVQPAAGEQDPTFGVEWDPSGAARLLKRALAFDASPAEDAEVPPLAILVADDSRLMRELISDGLHRLAEEQGLEGVTLQHAADGLEAWKLAQNGAFDLVLLDVHMPTLDGIAVLQKIRADEALCTTPVVVMSSDVKDQRRRALDEGADLYLGKPVRLLDLLQTVQALARARD